MSEMVVGVIGGSGLYEMEGLKGVKEIKTPFGNPSDAYIVGKLGNVKMVFLPRHGRGHRILPSELNFRANIYGMKKLGVEWIISVSAVGSMRGEIIRDTLKRNVATAKAIIKEAVPRISSQRMCKCAAAMKYAVLTDRKKIPIKAKKDLKIILGKYGI